MSPVLTPAEILGLKQLPAALTVAQAAQLLGVSRQTIYRAIEVGELKGIRVRGRVVVSAQPLVEAMGW